MGRGLGSSGATPPSSSIITMPVMSQLSRLLYSTCGDAPCGCCELTRRERTCRLPLLLPPLSCSLGTANESNGSSDGEEEAAAAAAAAAAAEEEKADASVVVVVAAVVEVEVEEAGSVLRMGMSPDADADAPEALDESVGCSLVGGRPSFIEN